MSADADDRLSVTSSQYYGIQLALQMLARLETIQDEGGTESEAWELDSEFRDGKPYLNLVHERLQSLRRLDPQVEEGFCMVLTQVIADVATGSGFNARGLRHLVRENVQVA